MMTSHVGVQVKLLRSLGGGDAIALRMGEQIDLSAGGITERAGYRRDRRSELGGA